MNVIGIEAYISNRSNRTCEFSVRMSGPRVIDREEIQKIFMETERGEFASRWTQEWQLGIPRLHRMRCFCAKSLMEKMGEEWRKLFARQGDC